jgi:hypothetical protein
MPELILDRGQREDFELGSAFMAALTYPEASRAVARAKLEAAQCSQILHLTNQIDRSNDPFEEPRLNRYLKMPRLDAHRIAERSRPLLDKRSTAARIARPWINEQINGAPHPPVEGISRFSLEQTARHVLGGADPKNFLNRIWRPGLPGIHLAVAVDMFLYLRPDGSSVNSEPAKKVEFEYHDMDTLRAIAQIAIHLQELIAHDSRFAISAEELIWLRWIE